MHRNTAHRPPPRLELSTVNWWFLIANNSFLACALPALVHLPPGPQHECERELHPAAAPRFPRDAVLPEFPHTTYVPLPSCFPCPSCVSAIASFFSFCNCNVQSCKDPASYRIWLYWVALLLTGNIHPNLPACAPSFFFSGARVFAFSFAV